MTGMAGNGWKLLDMTGIAGNCLKWQEWLEIAGNSKNSWNGRKLQELLDIAGKGYKRAGNWWKWLEWLEMAGNAWKWLDMAWKGWIWFEMDGMAGMMKMTMMMVKNKMGLPYHRFDEVLLWKEEGLTGFSKGQSRGLVTLARYSHSVGQEWVKSLGTNWILVNAAKWYITIYILMKWVSKRISLYNDFHNE